VMRRMRKSVSRPEPSLPFSSAQLERRFPFARLGNQNRQGLRLTGLRAPSAQFWAECKRYTKHTGVPYTFRLSFSSTQGTPISSLTLCNPFVSLSQVLSI
jgi:hypothetical protein